MTVSEKIRNLGLKSSSVYTLSDKVKEQPVMLLTNTDLTTNKKGNARDVQLGKCYDLLGTNEYIEIPDNDDFSFGDGSNDYPFSVSGWIYLDSVSTYFPILTKLHSTTPEWGVYTSGTSLFLSMYDDGYPNLEGRSISGFSTGSWIYICTTYNGVGSRFGINIYLNGELGTPSNVNSGSYTAMSNTTNNLQCGYGDSLDYANGKMFDVRLHNKELTQTEIYNVMDGAPSRYEVGWWKCDEGAGVVAHDSSGKGHHGLIKNATLSTFHVTNSALPYSFQNNAGFNIAKLYNSSTTTSTTSTSTTTTSTTTTSTSTSTTSSSTTSISTSTTSTTTSTSTSTTSSSSSSTTIT